MVDITFLEGIIKSRGIPDKQVENTFNKLVDEGFYLDNAITGLLKLLEEHRPEIAKKIARKQLAKQLSKK